MQVSELAEWFTQLDPHTEELAGTEPLIQALRNLLDSFVEIGLVYLSLDHSTSSLSGGEAQRVTMIRHLGSTLSDATYIFDEPSAGLHPHDVQRMIRLLHQLRDKGNTVLVVEHQPDVIRSADHLVELGPGVGSDGGQVVYQRDLAGLQAADTPPDAPSISAPGCGRSPGRRRESCPSVAHRSTTSRRWMWTCRWGC